MRLLYAAGLVGLVVLAASSHAQNQPQPAQQSSFPPSLYQMSDVSKALQLNDKQIQDLNTVTKDIQARLGTEFQKANAMTPEGRANRLQDLNRQYNAQWTMGAAKVLNEEQAKRYQQLQHQYGGFSSLNDPEVQKQLNLTDAQRKGLADHINWSGQQMLDINKQGANDPKKATELYRDYQKQHQDRFSKFLTPEQQKSWGRVTGEPHNFQPTFTQPAKR